MYHGVITPEIDQLKNYVSWRPEPFSQGTDDMQLDWSGKMFLPSSLIAKLTC